MQVNPQIEESWKEVLASEFDNSYFMELKEFLTEEKAKYTVYPPGSKIFNAFQLTPFNQVKVVILGQDPYHGSGTGTWTLLFGSSGHCSASLACKYIQGN